MGWTDRHKAYTALRATLHALRERLRVDESAQLSAQLPLVIRGVYWEGWNPHRTTDRPFLAEIHAAFRHDPEVDPECAARAVFSAMIREVSAGEMEDVRSILPRDIRMLMPTAKSAGEPLSRQSRRTAQARVSLPVVPGHEAALEPGDVGAARWGA
ncbi:MAG TPA: DUF2267 domain-containing protein [Chloroflexota bacterium]|nr:DUF2267 domain-containing protein [Chloroflexota bacterium]